MFVKLKITEKKNYPQTHILKRLTPYAYLTPVMVMIAALLFLPIILVIGYSFFDNVLVTPESHWVGLENYKTVLSDSVFVGSMKNTVIFVVMNVVFHLIIGMVLALMVNAKCVAQWAKAVFRVVYMLPWMFNATVIAILWKLLLNPNGVINFILTNFHMTSGAVEWLSDRSIVFWVLTFINIWAGYPFYMISILAGLQGISSDLYEAASIDGATGIKQFWHITCPLLSPTIFFVMITRVIGGLQVFDLIYMVIDRNNPALKKTQSLVYLFYQNSFVENNKGYGSTIVVLLLAIIMVITVFQMWGQKKWVHYS